MRTITLIIFLLFPFLLKAQGLMIEFVSKPDKKQIEAVLSLVDDGKIDLFDNFPSDYFKRLYKLTFQVDKGVEDKELLPIIIEDIKSLPFVINVEMINSFENLSIEPSEDTPELTNDNFITYQWALINQGQTVYKDLDDIHLENIKSLEGADIGISKIFNEIDQLMKRDVVVAILDTGVDLDHDDLKENIYRNQAECENNFLPFRPTEDKDGNGYIGDCMGWNFVSEDEGGDNRPYDDIGHGTHLAGIIAAKANNSLGISGLTNRLKIMPVRVLKSSERNSGRGRGRGGRAPNGGVTDRVAKGILYAIKTGADVINLSLGWPLAMDTKYLRETVKEATKKGIIVVAAAGNNNNQDPIYPCSYKDVVCAGATRIDGQLSNFTNYGGHVDIGAPGDNILSTYPGNLTPEHFSVVGYEIKNGTSQAAPYVAAIAGVLKGVFKDISKDEILGRIFSSSKTYKKDRRHKFNLNGAINLQDSIEASSRPVIRPIFKDIDDILVNILDNSFAFILPIKNYWALSKDVKVKISFTKDYLRPQSDHFEFSKIDPGETKEIIVKGDIEDLKADNHISIKVDITHQGETKSYEKFLKIVRNFSKDEHVINIPFKLDKLLKVALKNKDGIQPKIRTIIDPYFKSPYPQYYLSRPHKQGDQKGILVSIIKREGNEFKKIKNEIFIPNSMNLLTIFYMDFNYDNQGDYFIRTLARDGEEKYISFSFYNQDGEPLFGKYSSWRFVPEKVILNVKDFHLFPYESPTLGKVAIPIFKAQGKIPEFDVNPDPWEDKDYTKDDHFYYFFPTLDKEKDTIYLKTGIIDRYSWREKIVEQLNLDWDEEIDVLQLLPQSIENLKKGKTFGLLSVGQNYLRRNYVVQLSPNKNIKLTAVNTKGFHLEGNFLYPQISLDRGVDFQMGSTFVAHEKQTTIRLSMLSKLNQGPISLKKNFIYRRDYLRDHILGILASYKKGENYFTFFQTKNKLMLHSYNPLGGEKVSSRPITRFSFLPGELFSEMFYPIAKGIGRQRSPALYVDATQLNRNDIYLLTLSSEGKFISPINYNLRIPNNCKSMNPILFGHDEDKRGFVFSLLCEDKNNKWSMNYLPLQ